MVSPDYNLDELFTELLNKVNLTDEDKIRYMHDFDEKSLSEKMVLVKLIEGKAKFQTPSTQYFFRRRGIGKYLPKID